MRRCSRARRRENASRRSRRGRRTGKREAKAKLMASGKWRISPGMLAHRSRRSGRAAAATARQPALPARELEQSGEVARALAPRLGAQAQEQLGRGERVAGRVVATGAVDGEAREPVVEARGRLLGIRREERGAERREVEPAGDRAGRTPARCAARASIVRSNGAWKATPGASPAHAANARIASSAGTPAACAWRPMPCRSMFSFDEPAALRTTTSKLSPGTSRRDPRPPRRWRAGRRCRCRVRRSRCRPRSQRDIGSGHRDPVEPASPVHRSGGSSPDSRARGAAAASSPAAALPCSDAPVDFGEVRERHEVRVVRRRQLARGAAMLRAQAQELQVVERVAPACAGRPRGCPRRRPPAAGARGVGGGHAGGEREDARAVGDEHACRRA